MESSSEAINELFTQAKGKRSHKDGDRTGNSLALLKVPGDFFDAPKSGEDEAAIDHKILSRLCSSKIFPETSGGEHRAAHVKDSELSKALGSTTPELAVMKLEYWKSQIENTLSSEVYERGSSFVECTAQLHSLQTEVKQVCDLIESIRAVLSSAHMDLVFDGLMVPRLCHRQRNLFRISALLDAMSTVQLAPQRVEAMLDEQRNVGALELLATAENLYAKHKMIRLNSLKGLNATLRALRQRAESALQEDFKQLCIAHTTGKSAYEILEASDANDAVDAGKPEGLSPQDLADRSRDPLDAHFVAAFASTTRGFETFRELVRCGRLHTCVSSVTNEVFKKFTSAIEAECQASGLIRGRAAAKLAPIDFAEYIGALGKAVRHCTFHLRIAASFKSVLFALFEKELASCEKKEQKTHVQLSLTNFLQSAEDAVDDAISQVLRDRVSTAAKLTLAQLAQVYGVVFEYIGVASCYCRKRPQKTTQAFNAYAKCFLEEYLRQKSETVKTLLKNDSWKEAKVDPYYQRVADRILSKTVGKPSEQPAAQDSPSKDDCLRIGDKSFRTISSFLMFLSFTEEFMTLPQTVPIAGLEVAQKFIQFLLAFNQNVQRLILGTELTQAQASIAKITPKLLCLASQTVTALAELMPSITEFTVAAVAPNASEQSVQQLKQNFSAITELLRKHNNMIFTKFVTVLEGRVNRHFFSEREAVIGWYCPKDATKPAMPPPSPFVLALVDDLAKLHKILKTILQQEQVHSILAMIGEMMERELGKLLDEFNFQSTITGPRRLYSDMTILFESVEKLGVEAPGDALKNRIVEKYQLVGFSSQFAQAEKKK